MKFNDASLLFAYEVCIKTETDSGTTSEFGGTSEVVGTVHLSSPTSVLLL